MKYILVILLFLFSSGVTAQNFEDDFSDGDFTTNPTWSGADSNFVIFDLAGNNVLRLNDNEASTSYLSTPSTNVEGVWEFFVRIDGTAPANTNKAEIFLMSDTADLSGSVNGYAVRIGQTNDDFFKIVRLDGGTQTTILEDTTLFKAGGSYRLKVTRNASSEWSIEVGEGYNGELKNPGIMITDATYTTSSFFGVSVTYTVSRADDYYFDFKIEQPPVVIEPFFVNGFSRFSSNEMDISFSRDIDFSSVENSDFALNGNINPQFFSNQGSNAVRITFAEEFSGGENRLVVSGIESSTNDTVLTDTKFNFFLFDEFEEGNVVINEFLKDPPTGSGISEYIELKNTSSKYLNLKNWEIGDNNTLTSISDSDLVLLPDSFLVVTSNPEALTANFGVGIYVDVSLPALNNTTDQIRVFDGNGSIIDSLEYTTAWGGVDVALERKSVELASTFQANWGDSPNEIGTPGKENEVEVDMIPPDIESFEFLNDSTLQIVFTEEVKQNSAEDKNNYVLAVRLDVDLTPPQISDIELTGLDIIIVNFESAFEGDADGENFTIRISNQQDIFGNISSELVIEFEFREFDSAQEGDVVINEFMYDPADDYSEFVEIYNWTSSTFNLKGWTFNDNSGSQKVIITTDYFLEPNEYLVLAADSTIVESFPDTHLLDVSGFPSLNNSNDDLVLRNENGVRIDSLTYSTIWGGDEVSLERKSVEVSGIFQANWGDSPSPEFGTPGRANLIETDTTPPDIKTFEFLNDSTIQLIFTEEIKSEPAENPDNYGIIILTKANPAAVSSENEYVRATFFAPDTVLLEFDQPYYSYQHQNTLKIFNQEDIFGNIADQLSIQYELIRSTPAVPGDVAINEFMYDPASGYSEFVEIYNHTGKTINLNGWTLSDNTGNTEVIINENYYISQYNGPAVTFPSRYAILVPDSTISVSTENRIVMGSKFPSLNNSIDAIVLKNAEGITIDSLTYSSAWGGSEVSLERRTVEVSGTFQANWGDSPSPEFGTPGRENEIELDLEAPFLENAFLIDQVTIVLIFNESVIEKEALEPTNFVLNPSKSIDNLSVSRDTVRLRISPALVDGEAIEISIKSQEDIFGNTQENSGQVTLTYFEITPAIRNEVVVNEILYRRKDELSPEFIELFNTTNKNFDLSGWTFQDASSSKATIPNATFLPSGQYLVLTDREDFATALSNAIYLSSFPSLNDSGDEIIIKNAEGITIDSLFYKSTWGGNTPGLSVERKDPLRASNDASNWSSSLAEGGFSAGTRSSVFENDITPPEIIFASENDTSTFVAFSEFIQLTPQTIFRINEEEATVLGFNSEQANQIYIEKGQKIEAVPKRKSSSPLEIEIENLTDIKGNSTPSSSSSVAIPLEEGNVIINEIMFDPLANSEDNLPDQTEYIELYNPTNSAISLEGISLHDAPDEDNEVRSLFPVTSTFKWIQPKGYFLIYSEDEAETFAESKTARYFSMEEESDQFTMLIDRSSLSLAASDDAIYLADGSGATIDSVFFDESWQNPNIFDTDGIALERIDPLGPSNDDSNWSSSTHVSGGTPNAENTIFQKPGAVPESTGISFSPNPFSPDDDGFEDNLFINYSLDAPDYLLRVRIFDRYGREVRELADGVQAGFEGSLIWDGLTDDRKKNRVGIYIVLFEAYNSANGSDRTFKETVVLARMF